MNRMLRSVDRLNFMKYQVGEMGAVTNIQERVLRAISDVQKCQVSEIQLDASLRDDLMFDSLKQMTLFIVLEDEFGKSIPPEQVSGIHTVQDVVNFVEKKLAEPTAP